MRNLFDQGTPVPLRKDFVGHEVATAYEMGWSELSNGELLGRAESQFELLVSTDQNLPYQQNLQSRRLSILVLPTTSWPRLRSHRKNIVEAALAMESGSYLKYLLPQ
jgi:hypothetical protein